MSNRFFVNISADSQNSIEEHYDGLYSSAINNIVTVATSTALPANAPENMLYITLDDLSLYQYTTKWNVLNPGGSYNLPAATDTSLGGIKAPVKTTESEVVAIGPDDKLYVQPGSYTLPPATDGALGGIEAPAKTTESEVVAIGSDNKLYVQPGSYTLPAATADNLGGIKAPAKTTESSVVAIGADDKLYVASSTYSLPIASFDVLGGIETPAKTAADTQEVHVDSAGKLWTQEVDISNKADKFTYTPTGGTQTTYDLDAVKTFNIIGNGTGTGPNSGIIYTNFAGEQKVIDISGGSGFFNYKGQIATYERLPPLTDQSIVNGDLYSIYGPIIDMGTVALVSDLPTNYTSADDLKQFYITSVSQYRYWSQPTSSDTGAWVTNHCQQATGCDNQGWYAFGVGSVPHWNRLDGSLTVDQALDITSTNAIANKPVTTGLNSKVDEQNLEDTINWCISNIFPSSSS
jgi:hypothetical protein